MLFKFQWVVGITLRLGTEVEIAHPGEFIEASVPLALHLPHLFAGAPLVVPLLWLVDGEGAVFHADRLPGIDVLRVIDLHDESRQSAELPRPGLQWNLRREPRHEVAAPPVTRGFLALVAANGLLLRAQRPLHRRPRLRIAVVRRFGTWHDGPFR